MGRPINPVVWVRSILIVIILLFSVPHAALAESQENQDYKGITDPFGDPANYEFAEDEKDDKEFFHLGRFLMFGVDVGVGIYTGGLGSTTGTGVAFGGHFIYFFDKSLALELAVHYSNAEDIVQPSSTQLLDISATLIPIELGMRYYFDIHSAPKFIAIANPYLAFGAGVYMRTQSILQPPQGFSTVASDSTTTSFGGYGGAGIEFNIYKRHVYMGLDFRYHLIFFGDEGDNFGVPGVDRSGDYVTGLVSLTYNF